MFLIFILFRKNIFSKKDLALLNSIKLNYNIENLTDKKIENSNILDSIQYFSITIILEIY